jgi:hypothetical protein
MTNRGQAPRIARDREVKRTRNSLTTLSACGPNPASLICRSMTSWASKGSMGLSVFAVLRLIVSANLVGFSRGPSRGNTVESAPQRQVFT